MFLYLSHSLCCYIFSSFFFSRCVDLRLQIVFNLNQCEKALKELLFNSTFFPIFFFLFDQSFNHFLFAQIHIFRYAITIPPKLNGAQFEMNFFFHHPLLLLTLFEGRSSRTAANRVIYESKQLYIWLNNLPNFIFQCELSQRDIFQTNPQFYLFASKYFFFAATN